MANMPGALLTCHDVSRPHFHRPAPKKMLRTKHRTPALSASLVARSLACHSRPPHHSIFSFISQRIGNARFCFPCTCTKSEFRSLRFFTSDTSTRVTTTADKHTPSETAALLENVARYCRPSLHRREPPLLAFASALPRYGPVLLPTPAGSLLWLSFSSLHCQVRIYLVYRQRRTAGELIHRNHLYFF